MFATSFRNTLIASTLLVSASMLASPVAFADTDPLDNSGDVTGTIASVSEVSYTAPAGATLSPTAGNTDMAFGTVNVQDNSAGGWTLTVASTQGGKLSNGEVTEIEIPYTGLSFANATLGTVADVDVSTAEAAETVYSPTALTCATTAGCDAAITADIAIGDINGKPADTYTDTLTFTLTSTP